MSSRFALVALMSLTLAACEGTGLPGMSAKDATPAEQGHKGPPKVSPLEAPIETGGEIGAVATADARTLNVTAFSARGNEPFWSVDVAGRTALYKTPDNQKGRAVRVDRLTFAGGVEYVGVLNGKPFALTIRGRDCTDDMSGQKFPMLAELKVSSRRNTGCAAPAAPEVAQAVAAIKAPAPAAPKATAAAKPKPAATRPVPSKTPAQAASAAADSPAPAQTTTTTTPASPSLPAPVLTLPMTPPAVTPELAPDAGAAPAATQAPAQTELPEAAPSAEADANTTAD